MGKQSARTIRDLRIAARDGDPAAARALLRRCDKGELAAEIRRGKPFPPRVRKMIGALTAGTGTRDKLGYWERLEADGTIDNLLLDVDTPPFKTPARDEVLEDEGS
jgi:hypothetical protein